MVSGIEINPFSVLAWILYDPAVRVAVKVVTAEDPLPLTAQVFAGISMVWVESIVETNRMLLMVAATALVAEKTIVLDPPETLAADVRLAVGVLAVTAVYVLVIVLTGPLKVIVKAVPSAAAGIKRSIALDVQQETMLTGMGNPPEVMVMEKLTPSMEAGYDPPLVKETIPPAVEAPDEDQL